MWSGSDLKERARAVLQGPVYWKAVLVGFILMVVGGIGGSGGSSAGGSSSSSSGGGGDVGIAIVILIVVLVVAVIAAVISLVISAFVTNPMKVGCSRFFTIACIQNDANVNEIGIGFKSGRYMNVVKSMFSVTLEVFLWSLLLIIPGIIKQYEYKMVPYILAENPDMSGSEAKELSKRMMEGEKMNAFWLDFSFIGWWLVAGITCMLAGIFWVVPYYSLTQAELYLVLRSKLFVNSAY